MCFDMTLTFLFGSPSTFIWKPSVVLSTHSGVVRNLVPRHQVAHGSRLSAYRDNTSGAPPVDRELRLRRRPPLEVLGPALAQHAERRPDDRGPYDAVQAKMQKIEFTLVITRENSQTCLGTWDPGRPR
jgi:hypothetical protein